MNKLFDIVQAFFRGVICTKCKSCNVTLDDFSIVNPENIKDAHYVIGCSIAVEFGMESAKGNYKKTASGDIYQTRDEIYRCRECNNKFTVRREYVVASAP